MRADCTQSVIAYSLNLPWIPDSVLPRAVTKEGVCGLLSHNLLYNQTWHFVYTELNQIKEAYMETLRLLMRRVGQLFNAAWHLPVEWAGWWQDRWVFCREGLASYEERLWEWYRSDIVWVHLSLVHRAGICQHSWWNDSVAFQVKRGSDGWEWVWGWLWMSKCLWGHQRGYSSIAGGVRRQLK